MFKLNLHVIEYIYVLFASHSIGSFGKYILNFDAPLKRYIQFFMFAFLSSAWYVNMSILCFNSILCSISFLGSFVRSDKKMSLFHLSAENNSICMYWTNHTLTWKARITWKANVFVHEQQNVFQNLVLHK